MTEPLDYFAFQKLISDCSYVLTDSGGIQEETTYLKVPCLTLRENTERPVTVEVGTNVLVGQDTVKLRSELAKILEGRAKLGNVPSLWDGCASERIADVLEAKIR